jgi:hypothetical protein
VAAAVDEERGCAGNYTQVGAVDILGDPGSSGLMLQIVGKPFDVELELRFAATTGRRTSPHSVDRWSMRWRELIRSERGSITPHAAARSRASRTPGGYAFNPDDYPSLAEAADAWTQGRIRQGWRSRLRSMKNLVH